MTRRDDLEALAARVEALTGPCRQIDAEIYHALLNGIGTGFYGTQPAFTASIDAAMTLVPKGCSWSVQYSDITEAEAWIFPPNNVALVQFYAETATPAHALTAASLRALAAQEPTA